MTGTRGAIPVRIPPLPPDLWVPLAVNFCHLAAMATWIGGAGIDG